MNKLDEFFNKHLTDYTEAEDGWNIPKDDLWDKARQHFPEEKKKKRGLIWWFFGLGILLGFASAYFLFAPNQSWNQVNQQMTNADIKTKEEVKKKSNDTNIISKEKTENITAIGSEVVNDQSKSNSNTEIKERVDIMQAAAQLQSKEKNQIKQDSELTIKTIPFQNKTTDRIIDKAILPLTANENNALTESIVEENQVVEEDQVVEANDKKLKEAISPLLLSPSLISKLSLQNFNQAPGLSNSMALSTPIDVAYKQRRPKKEFGVGRTLFLVSLLEYVNLEDDPRDDINIDISASNINLNTRYWFKPRWSIQSGIHLSKLELKLDLSDFIIIEEDNLEELSDITFNDLVSQNGISARSNWETDLDFEDLGIEVGDEVNFMGKIDQSLRAIQIPVFVNFHWYKRKLEYFMGAGPTLEHIWNNQSAEDVRMISNEKEYMVNFKESDLNAKYFDYSLYVNGGMKYKITNNINLEMAIKISILEPIFSGLDIGINYRWNN